MDGTGTLKKPIDRTSISKPNLDVVLKMPFDLSGTITGTVSAAGGAWTSALSGYKEATVSTYDGTYTLALPGNVGNALNEPGGDGVASVVVSGGEVSISGNSADNQKLKQKLQLSSAGKLPFYSTAAKDSGGLNRSVLMGWLTWDGTKFTGDLDFDRQNGATVAPYTGGFTALTTVAMSPYYAVAPANAQAAFGGATAAAIVFDGPTLVVVSNSAVISSAGILVDKAYNKTNNKVNVKLKTASGLFTPVQFEAPLGTVWKGGGVALTNEGTYGLGHGYVVPADASHSERFTLTPQ